MLAIFTLNETEYIYRICQIFVARFRIWGGLSNALGRLSLPVAPGLHQTVLWTGELVESRFDLT